MNAIGRRWKMKHARQRSYSILVHLGLSSQLCKLWYGIESVTEPSFAGGPEAQSGSLGLAARAGVSTEHWALPSVRQRRVGQLLGLSISSPLAERVSGRTASVGPISLTVLTAAAMPPWSDCKECAAVSIPGRPALKVSLGIRESR